jgi:hypothetical protein
MKRICVFCGASKGRGGDYIVAARETGRLIAARGWGLVYGGGAVGLMGVVADAAMAAGGEVIGVIPETLMKREVGHRRITRLHVVQTMHERKAMMASLSDGFLVLPGGYGTLEEAFEALTWAQLGIQAKGVCFVDTLGYWSRLLATLDAMAEEGFLRPEFRALALTAPDPAEALALLDAFVPPKVERWAAPVEL